MLLEYCSRLICYTFKVCLDKILRFIVPKSDDFMDKLMILIHMLLTGYWGACSFMKNKYNFIIRKGKIMHLRVYLFLEKLE